MFDHQAKIDQEFRLLAMEYVLGKVCLIAFKTAGLSRNQVENALDRLADGSKEQKFPGLDPVMSDLASDKYAHAIKRLSDLIKTMAVALG
jgi:hypothetical protein